MTERRKVYLDMVSLETARKRLWSRFAAYRTGEEEVPVAQCLDRVASRPVTARLSAPAHHLAAMDGIAVRAEETFGASDDRPLILDLDAGQAELINTGQVLPPDKDAVIMIEHVVFREAGRRAVIRSAAFPWQHVRKVGEDIVATELLFPTGHRFGPADLGALLTAGRTSVWVRKRPKVRIQPTGSELVEAVPDLRPEPGQTIEANGAVLAALAARAGAEAEVLPICPDDYRLLRNRMRELTSGDADLVVFNAGSSAGSADYTLRLIEELGEVLVHGVTIMPGKPTILGVVAGKPVIGSPGYPVSALISFEEIVVPLLASMQGLEAEARPRRTARLAKDLPSRSGIEEFRRMITGRIGGELVTIPLKKGAGAITTITKANTLLRIPAASEGLVRGEKVCVELLRGAGAIDRTILCCGSHDLCLDLIRDLLGRRRNPFHLASSHVGSLGGIMAIRDQMAHVAGTHLLDPESGEYNIPYLRRYLARPARLITLVHRVQGFMVRPGNPKGVKTVADLCRPDVTFVNRQVGSGTRVLLDHELARRGLDPTRIPGYDNEEYTHMGVGVAVLSGKADVGLGILAAARALGLDFVPVCEERYDLLMDRALMAGEMLEVLLEVITSRSFADAVAELGGYSTRDSGREHLFDP